MQTGTIIKKPVTIDSELAKPIYSPQQRDLKKTEQTSYLSTSPMFFPKTGKLICHLIPVLQVQALDIFSLVFKLISPVFCLGKHDVD
jgi:membrane protein required for beta-lactamase induction